MQKLKLQNEADRKSLIVYLNTRIIEYKQDLCEEGLTPQQYNILRGKIKELQDLVSELDHQS
ncbi:hypothetical protein [uncultured Aggregatibacter sp.]|mgnify:FL=1|uniref:hypothetical protein n=1 Tax=uncultured Aggregatibacter sp. TaxID=470564 RepID=UPI001A44BA5D|nr:hypothetical protein [uncultured Aggregatibacter sp.]VTX83876.1 Uncharacterised protein [uncultured Aggregatibacter sp.]